MSEAAALVALALCLASAIARPRLAPDWAVAVLCALALMAFGVISAGQAHASVNQLGPTVGFLAALLVLAAGCAREGLFAALGAAMARGSRGRPKRLLAMVFVCASLTTAVLSLDATVVLLTPVVFVTAARIQVRPRPHVLACAHLANSASLVLPVSNLTNLLAFQATGLSFVHFAGLMVAPWLAAVGVEWLVLSRVFADELAPSGNPTVGAPVPDAVALPRFASAVVAATLAGFAISSAVGLAPVWVAAAGAIVLTVRDRPSGRDLVNALQPGFLLFVLGLGVVVRGAGQHGLSAAIDSLLPHGSGLAALLGIAAMSAVASNLLNNLPATLALLPVVAATGRTAVLAMLIGVGIGPNLTYVGSLATLLWRRVLRSHDEHVDARAFVALGLLTVPPALIAATVALWLAAQVL